MSEAPSSSGDSRKTEDFPQPDHRQDDSFDDGLSLPFTGHLEELRTRILRVLLGVLILGGMSLAFSQEIFAFLMAPILGALPPGHQSLIYTSGIEELNVLLKVGLYAGIFLCVPWILREAWQFVAPGLLKAEKRFLLPFVTLGTAFFLLGAAFCYGAVLPSMFTFLLSPNQAVAQMEPALRRANQLLGDGRRLWVLGEDARGEDFALKSLKALEKEGTINPSAALDTSSTSSKKTPAQSDVELSERFSRCQELLDASLLRRGRHNSLRAALESHERAQVAREAHHPIQASEKLDETVAFLAQGFSHRGSQTLNALWAAHKQVAAKEAQKAQLTWTRPMLSMKEQLSLVLVLELAFGLIFELPLIMGALARLGLLKFSWVWGAQKYAIVGCVIASALITPTGDVINLALMAVPMVICFEVGVALVFLMERRLRDDKNGQS